MAKSHYQQEQHPSRDFLESAGAILFDFRSTGVSSKDILTYYEENGIESVLEKLVATTAEPRIALVYSGQRDETLLPKGRRNVGEAREAAALRETYEETGLRCHLLPVTLRSRATSIDPSQDRLNAGGYTMNEVRNFSKTTDPFWMTMRHSKDGRGHQHVKLIWWYIAVVDDEQDETPIEIDPGCELKLEMVGRAAAALEYESDREIVREAISVLQATLGYAWVI